MQAIILAGGKGRRLLPYTTVLPKPLMPIGDYPIIEVILRQLKRDGFQKVNLCTGYLHDLIHAYLTSNHTHGLDVTYTHEEIPLGTIGPLRLIDNLDDTFLVMNGDILTNINFRDLFLKHKEQGAIATVATYRREVHIEFGVLEQNQEHRITEFREKPTYSFDVNMGIYIFSRRILDYIPPGVPFGFDHLIQTLTTQHEAVYAYPHSGYWLDIGKPDDYSRSIETFEQHKDIFLP
jgi:NDP-sugar pyrophosphorylase family protein